MYVMYVLYSRIIASSLNSHFVMYEMMYLLFCTYCTIDYVKTRLTNSPLKIRITSTMFLESQGLSIKTITDLMGFVVIPDIMGLCYGHHGHCYHDH
jgi:hypothetical protein